MWLIKAKKFFLDLFFPKKCLGCNQADTYLCPACFNKIELIQNNECFFCKKITWQGKICLSCQKENYLDRIISATNYGNPLIRDLIKAFKYHFVKELTRPLSQLLIKILEDLEIKNKLSLLIIPIPLYKTKLRTRGFNQAELLAEEIAHHFNLQLQTAILKRKIQSVPQANINDDAKRKENIKGAFEIVESEKIKDKIIILMDDVITTGATLTEAAKTLKENGAKEVCALTIARG